LKPESAVDAVRKVRPFGVESAPGKMDYAKIRAFITAVRTV
jgi:phosphoribosylanthranilate isomerase